MKNSIPVGLPINEKTRLLCFLKAKYQAGYFSKSCIGTLCREYGKDPRTISKTLKSLMDDGLMGEDSKTYYLRQWKFITGKKALQLQSFEASMMEIRKKDFFECKQLAAKVTAFEKSIRWNARVRKRGFTDQIATSTGLLSKACQISHGKVTQLKKRAQALGFIAIKKSFEDLGAGTTLSSKVLCSEKPGVFLKEGRLKRRQADQIISVIATYRIRNRKTKTTKKQR